MSSITSGLVYLYQYHKTVFGGKPMRRIKISILCAIAFFLGVVIASCASSSSPTSSIPVAYSESEVLGASDQQTPQSINENVESNIPSTEGKIAFIGYVKKIINKNGDSVLALGIFVINADGSNLVKATNDDFQNGYSLRWSPDGKELAYIGVSKDSNNDIYIFNMTDKSLFQVTHSGVGYPMWSPDGNKLLFTGFSNEQNLLHLQVFDINKDGTGQSCLTCKSTNVQSDNYDASWSPDGLKIAYISNHDSACVDRNSCTHEIYVMNVDGTNQVLLTNNSSKFDFPIWSFDGKHIAYLSERIDPPISVDICVMNADGSDNKCLAGGYTLDPSAFGGIAHLQPIGSLGFTWTNKGKIAAYLTDGTRSGIYSIDMNGTASFLFDGLPFYAGYSLSGSSESNSIPVVTNKYRYNDPLSESDSIYMINTINGNKTFVFSDPTIVHIGEPHWSP
jgi:TolB protein